MLVDVKDSSIRRKPIVTDADVVTRIDSVYNDICQKFMQNLDYFSKTLDCAWSKLTDRNLQLHK